MSDPLPPDLKQVLADMREDAAMAHRLEDERLAKILERHADAVQAAAEPWLRWLSEDEAHLKSGASVRWLRAQFPRWAERDLARWDGPRRIFRDVAIPQRQHLSAVREDARRQARRSA